MIKKKDVGSDDENDEPEEQETPEIGKGIDSSEGRKVCTEILYFLLSKYKLFHCSSTWWNNKIS